MILRRLDRDHAQALLAALGREVPPDRVVDTLFLETDGNPFFLEEAVAHFGEEGRLFDESGRWLPRLDVAEDEVPRNVWLLLGQRLARLSEPARRVLNAAAISRQFGLLTNDALVVAIMQDQNIVALASHDGDFDRVPMITRYSPY